MQIKMHSIMSSFSDLSLIEQTDIAHKLIITLRDITKKLLGTSSMSKQTTNSYQSILEEGLYCLSEYIHQENRQEIISFLASGLLFIPDASELIAKLNTQAVSATKNNN